MGLEFFNELINKNHKMYVIKNLNFEHVGTGSAKKKYVNEILINRNWHFSWSKFYFFKKNFNYPYALKKVIPNIYQSLLGIIGYRNIVLKLKSKYIMISKTK